MADLDPASRRMITDFPVPEGHTSGRGRVFKSILRAASTVASIAIPGVGPAIGAIGGQSETLQYLELQREIERETRMFETASNVLKARHDATMSSIRNIKS